MTDWPQFLEFRRQAEAGVDLSFAHYVHLMASFAKPVPEVPKRGAIPIYDKEFKARVVAQYAATRDVDATAEEFGLSGWTVRRWAAKAGQYQPRSASKYTEAQWEKVRALLAEGYSANAAARLTGIPKGTIQHWRHR